MEKKYKNGLVLGKFCPFSKGHQYLIDSAIEKCDNVHIMVCTLNNEPIKGLHRAEWIFETYKNNSDVAIYWCQDENPQKPEECNSVDEFYYNYWCPSVYSRIKTLDVVFTSEEYGDEFAKYLGVKHELVDIDRIKVPVSGTSIRVNAFKMWNYIPDIVKPYFVKKIAILGPESVGKSTMVKKLSDFYNTNHVEEYGRTYCEIVKPASDFDSDDFIKISLTHNELINERIKTANKLLFVDTEAITTKIFGEMYLNNFESDKIESIINSQLFDLYIILSPDVPWVDDGTRDFPTGRFEHFEKIKSELKKYNKDYFVIDGDNYEDRFIKACELIDSKLLNNVK